ncbi:hypothetical protein GCM10022240_29540 [Microbacterium kribbense]|uniref:HNH endonuclease n=1 Tax=Microbacterium kribbense TaxID=433645 RepID=A0ABP7GWI2_9MICO
MSNRRRPALMNLYRSEFLRSGAWFARRDAWFAEQRAQGVALTCAACARTATARELELHHLDYTGITLVAGTWRALERHDDLVPMHPYCHDLLHRLIDRDVVLAHNRTRRAASLYALAQLQRTLIAIEGSAS